MDQSKKTRVTIYEVAKRANVSLATVSRVINNTGNVSQDTVDKVNSVIAKLGYQPSSLAKSLATSKSATIAIIVPSTNYVYISNLLHGVIDVAKERGVNLTIFTTSHSSIDAYKVIDNVIKSRVDGAVVFDDELNSEDIKFINSYSVPCVVINHNVSGEFSACVTFNHEKVLYNIVKDNIDHNGKDMVFVHINNGGRLMNRCEKSFIAANEECKHRYQIFNCDDSYTNTYNSFMQYFSDHKNEYFVVYRDSIAGAVINAAIDSGLRIPEDVEVLSIVGTKYSHILRPNVSSLNVDFIEVGKIAMNMLSDLCDGTLNQKICSIDVQYIKRGTTLR